LLLQPAVVVPVVGLVAPVDMEPEQQESLVVTAKV
jgi:hypothetical protein